LALQNFKSSDSSAEPKYAEKTTTENTDDPQKSQIKITIDTVNEHHCAIKTSVICGIISGFSGFVLWRSMEKIIYGKE
jgi:hypothetical protein